MKLGAYTANMSPKCFQIIRQFLLDLKEERSLKDDTEDVLKDDGQKSVKQQSSLVAWLTELFT